MNLAWIVSVAFAVLALGCRQPQEDPARAANEFLRALHREECKKAFESFSLASQEKIRLDAAKAAKDYPTYAADFTPENFYCKSAYANRFLIFHRGSAKLQTINGSNAIVTVTYSEGTNYLIPGFLPTKFVKLPSTLQLVKESGSWKIDLVTPSPAEKGVIAAREKAINQERQRMEEFRRQESERLYANCTNFRLLAHWTFAKQPLDGKVLDETGSYSAELLGAGVVELPDGKALQFVAEQQAVKLPEELLNHRGCGAIIFWFRRDDSQTLNRVLLKVLPGSFCETGIEVHPDGTIHYNVQRNSISSNEKIEPHKFYHLAFIWNQNGMRTYINGNLDTRLNKPVYIGGNSTKTEMGRDPNNAARTGSCMAIRDLKIYEGTPTDAQIAELLEISR